jgi:hypothetical protein
METRFILGSLAVVALSGFLYINHCRKPRRRSERFGSIEWDGQAMDITKLKPTIEDVRRDYLAARPSTRGIFFHKQMLGLAHRAVTRSAYFHDRETEEHALTHSP